jgi:hypothetical protein
MDGSSSQSPERTETETAPEAPQPAVAPPMPLVDRVKLVRDILHPLRDDLPKPEWFTLKRTAENKVEIEPTEACRQEPRCAEQHHLSDVAFMSLWRSQSTR